MRAVTHLGVVEEFDGFAVEREVVGLLVEEEENGLGVQLQRQRLCRQTSSQFHSTPQTAGKMAGMQAVCLL